MEIERLTTSPSLLRTSRPRTEWALAEELAVESEEVKMLSNGLKTAQNNRVKKWITKELSRSIAREKQLLQQLA